MKLHAFKLLILMGIFLFGSIVINKSGFFAHTRLDLTENKLFTLDQGTKNILKNIDESIHLKLYFSDDATQNIPLLRTYKNTVFDLLNEMKRYSDAKLNISLIDPKIFSTQEDEAAQFGLQALSVGEGGESVFFGLVGENTFDGVEIIPFLQPDRESFLEYDIAQLIYSLNSTEKKVIGIMSSINLKDRFDQVKQEVMPAQVFITQLSKDFVVKDIDINSESIDYEVDVLMLIHPKIMSDKTLFGIDQFVMKGGRLIVFVDPFSQAEIIKPDPVNPMAALQIEKKSDLKKLFTAWNVKYDAKTLVLDDKFALNIQVRTDVRPSRHLAYLSLNKESFNKKDMITRELESINLATVGYFESDNIQAILSSSIEADTINSDAVKLLTNPNSLFNNYKAMGKKLTIAGRLKGTIKTAFPNAVEGVDKANIISKNDNPKVVLFADADFLFNQLWVRSQKYYGRNVFTAFADNGNMISNLLDNMAGSPDLINIRGRQSSSRPFTKVIELQKASDNKFREQENVLKQRLRETEEKLNAIQREKGQQNRMILSQEQEQEIQRFQTEKLEVRKKLREVRRSLDKDIKELGSHLKIINIGLMPILISLIGLFVLWIKPRRKGGKYAK